jgi:hypothetical protein
MKKNNGPDNTVGTQITGEPRDTIPDQFHEPKALDQGRDQVVRPTETARPHLHNSDHLTPSVPPLPGPTADVYDTMFPKEESDARSPEPIGPETIPGTGPRTGLGRGQ